MTIDFFGPSLFFYGWHSVQLHKEGSFIGSFACQTKCRSLTPFTRSRNFCQGSWWFDQIASRLQPWQGSEQFSLTKREINLIKTIRAILPLKQLPLNWNFDSGIDRCLPGMACQCNFILKNCVTFFFLKWLRSVFESHFFPPWSDLSGPPSFFIRWGGVANLQDRLGYYK